MPKLKSVKGLRKRVKITARGTVMHYKGGKSHLLSGKSGKRRRHLRREAQVLGAMAKRFKRAYGV